MPESKINKKCPKCNCDMKEQVVYWKCLNSGCLYKIKKDVKGIY